MKSFIMWREMQQSPDDLIVFDSSRKEKEVIHISFSCTRWKIRNLNCV